MLQEQFWHLEQAIPGTGLFHIPLTMRLSGNLDVAALEYSVHQIVQCHDMLRTVFPAIDGHPVQRVVAPVYLPIEVTDLRQWPEPERTAYAERLA
ncbi:hypothetical protein C2W62_42870, partial [Candidatus Entotheonella serta]